MQRVSWFREDQKLAQKEKVKYLNSEIAYIINEYIHSERDRKILLRRYIDGIKLEPLAEEFGLSVPQIKNIVYRYQAIIFEQLKATKD